MLTFKQALDDVVQVNLTILFGHGSRISQMIVVMVKSFVEVSREREREVAGPSVIGVGMDRRERHV